MPHLQTDVPPEGSGVIGTSLWKLAARLGVARLVWSTHALFLVLVWGTLAALAVGQMREREAELTNKAELNAKGFAEYVGLNIFVIDRMLGQLRSEYRQTGKLPLQEKLAAELGDLGPVVQQVAVADAFGRITASTLPLTQPVFIADRKHFRAVRDDPRDRLFISEPVIGRVSGRMSLQLVRPILNEKGEFAGAIVGSIDPTLLQKYFQNYEGLVENSVVTLVGNDGINRLRMQGGEITWGQKVSGAPTWPRVMSTTSGVYRGRSVVDGRHRIYAYQHVGDYPLTVLVGYATPIFKDVLDSTLLYAFTLSVFVTLVLTGLARAIARLATHQYRLIRQLRTSRAKALEANQMKSNFLASVSHELRTPLNSILGFSELIREVCADPVIFKYADLIHRSGKHLHALVSTILDLAKIEAGRMEVMKEPVDMRELLGAIVDVHRVSADKKQLTLSLTLPAQDPLLVNADRTKFVQVLNNVIHNAVKFTANGGIFVTAAVTPEQDFVVSVVDTGIGIAPDMLPRIFDRFNTVGDPATQQDDRGTGLGLALSRELMELMGGTVTVGSEPGYGTQVSITLRQAVIAAAA